MPMHYLSPLWVRLQSQEAAIHFITAFRRWSLSGLAVVAVGSSLLRAQTPNQDLLPPALRHYPLGHLSSGAIMILHPDAGLVRWPSAVAPASQSPSSMSAQASEAALDWRVGSNIRLGEDPEPLPAANRAQAEPHIVRSPVNPDLLLAIFQEGRYTNAGAVSCGYAVSHDGGLSWTRSLIPGLTQVSGGPYFRASDPVAAIDHRETLYLNTVAAANSSFGLGVVTLSRSTNGGATFDPPVEVFRSTNETVFPDKNWMAVNSFSNTPTAGRIVVTFTRISGSTSPIAATHSDDGGKTWTTPVLATPSTSVCQGSQPVFLPDGKLAVVYWNFMGTGTDYTDNQIEVVLSRDGGESFGAGRRVTRVTLHDDPLARDAVFLPSASADRTRGDLYVAFQGRHLGNPRVLFTKSADQGATWTVPVPTSDNPAEVSVFNPAIAVSPDGQRVAIVFYDKRVNPARSELVDLFLAQSLDGGATWEPNLRLTQVPSDLTLSPLTAYGYMLGDYIGMAESTAPEIPAVAVFINTRSGSPDPFVARAGIARQLDFGSWRAARFSAAAIGDLQRGSAGADPDADGVVNSLEYALGLNPVEPDRIAFTTRAVLDAGGTALEVGYRRIRGAADLRFSWEGSSGLTDWVPASDAHELVTPAADGLTESVTALFSATAEARAFRRLRVGLVDGP